LIVRVRSKEITQYGQLTVRADVGRRLTSAIIENKE
jgi:hypothetical protein